jgi:hypothetical protein
VGEGEVEGGISEKDGERDAERGGQVGHGGGCSGKGIGGDDVGSKKALVEGGEEEGLVEGEEEWVPKTVEEIEEYKKREAARLKVTHAQRLNPERSTLKLKP